MMLIYRRTLKATVVVFCVLLATSVSAAGGKEKKETSVEPTDWGVVTGAVYDAQTGSPLQGTTVTVEHEGTFEDKGKTIGTTGASGRYSCQALIGRQSSSFNIGCYLFGDTDKTPNPLFTNRLDVSQLNIRVRKDGYRPFEGVVKCTNVIPNEMKVLMEPILLAGASSGEESTTADGWGIVKLSSLTIEPSILRPGAAAIITARVQCPLIPKQTTMKCVMRSSIWKTNTLNLTNDPTPQAMVFSRTFNVSKKLRPLVELVNVEIEKSPYDVVPDCSSKSALVQVVLTDEEEKVARLRDEAHKLRDKGDRAVAFAKFEELGQSPEANVDDFRWLATTSQAIGNRDSAMGALERVLTMTAGRDRLTVLAQYADMLLQSGQVEKAIQESMTEVEKIKEEKRPRSIPVCLMVVLGKAYLASGKLDLAAKVGRDLLEWPDAGSDPGAVKWKQKLRLAKAEAMVSSNFGEAQAWAALRKAQALAEYGRVLSELGRWEEAVEQFCAVLKLHYKLPVLDRDLNYALIHTRGINANTKRSLDEAITAAQQLVVVGEKREKSREFIAWHTLAILLYAKAYAQKNSKDPGAVETMSRCGEALIDALKCGRGEPKVDTGGHTYLYSGFMNSVANTDFAILQGLRILDRYPDNYLAHFTLAAALSELERYDLTEVEARKCLELKPDYVEAKFLIGVAAMRSGNKDQALTLLQEVLKANPRHPKASFVLADLYTRSGNAEAAVACLAAYNKYYNRG